MAWLNASLALQAALALYFQAVVWFPLGAWNDQPGERLIELVRQGETATALGFALPMLLPLLLYAIALWRRWIWALWCALIGYSAWAALQIQSWWIPWTFGPDARALRNARALAHTYKLFPSTPNHLAPDAMHFVLDLLLFGAVGTIAAGLLKVGERQPTSTL